eukprot:Selendium_serpulae@DN6408_c0_g1_i5.p1
MAVAANSCPDRQWGSTDRAPAAELLGHEKVDFKRVGLFSNNCWRPPGCTLWSSDGPNVDWSIGAETRRRQIGSPSIRPLPQCPANRSALREMISDVSRTQLLQEEEEEEEESDH